MIKVKQVVAAGEGVIALTEDGELYCGFFTGGNPFKVPDFGWRKIPTIDPECKEYKTFKELTPLELAAAKRKAEKQQ